MPPPNVSTATVTDPNPNNINNNNAQRTNTDNNNWAKRYLSNLEPILQHQGVVYTFIFFYTLLNVVFFFVGASPAWNNMPSMPFVMRASTALARGGAAMLNLNASFIILVAARSLMTYLRQTFLNMFVPFDKAMPAFHSFVGNFLAFSTFVHTLAHIVRYSVYKLRGPGFFGHTSLAITGSFLTLIVILMRVTSLLRVRRSSFETFFWVHHIGFVLFFILILLHGSHNGALKSWMYILFPLTVYIMDRSLRLTREQGSRLSITRESAVIKGADMLSLRIPRTFAYLAGQYCDIKVPLVSNMEWHPFTIASSPHQNEMLFYIKVNGDWTKKLYELIKSPDTDNHDIHIHVRGPYGAPAQHVGQYEHVVLISGGVGATPFCAITKYAHHWMLNYTQRGVAASTSVSAAFTRNQSIHGTPSAPGTPTRHASSGHASANRRSHNTSRPISRNQSAIFSQPPSGNFSQPPSRTGSRQASRSGSGRLDRFNSARLTDSSRHISDSTSANAERLGKGRPLSATQVSGSGSGHIAKSVNTSTFQNATSARTPDSSGVVLRDPRGYSPFEPMSHNDSDVPSMNPLFDPNGVTSGSAIPPVGPIVQEEIVTSLQSMDDASLQRLVDLANEIEDNEFTRPDDYDEDLGNPDLPIPDRKTGVAGSSNISGNLASSVEIMREYNSSQGLFDEDEEHVEEEVAANLSRDGILNLGIHVNGEGLELEDQILREQTASNAYNMLGMSYGPLAMMRHIHELDAKKMRSSLMRTSMNLMNDAMDAALWQDRLLFYLHTVTINWVLLWLMLVRFSLVFIGRPTGLFSFSQLGLGIFTTKATNIADLVLAVLVTAPLVGAIGMEMYVNHVEAFLTDSVANSFDLVVLVPLLFGCVTLHILNLAGIGEGVEHISKLTVCCIWPLLSMFILWRIVRTIGSRVVLAPYLKSTHAQTKSLDYIWVSKTHEDDTWVVDELLPLADSNIVRLHRFITRHGPKTEPWMLEYEKVPLKTTYSRPDWDEVFGGLVERSKSGTVVGVFFCGPDSMARMIQQAALKAMAKSMDNAYQRGYFTKKAGGSTARTESSTGAMDATASNGGRAMGGGSLRSVDGGRAVAIGLHGIRSTAALAAASKKDEEGDSSAYGCSVRIAIRVENFS